MPIVKQLGLYDLLAPQFLAGFRFPQHIDEYLSVLAVAELQTTSDPNAVLYTGTVYFPSGNAQAPVLKHRDPSGAVFDFHDITLRFRLLIPRAGASFLQTAINAISITIPAFEPLKDEAFGKQDDSPTDYPGISFQLDLLFDLLSFHLGEHWKPAKVNLDLTVSADPAAKNSDVLIHLPKVLFRYSQDQDFSKDPLFEMASWGDPGFDAPNDLAEGQLATMEPPLAIHSSGRVAFGIDTIVLDLSENGTPDELLEHFGVDEGFKGLYAKAIQVYWADRHKDFALNFAVRDALISFAGEVWLEAELDLLFVREFSVSITAYDGQTALAVNPGTKSPLGVWVGGSLTMPTTGVLYLQVAGGLPPYNYSVTGLNGIEWDEDLRQAKFSQQPTSSESVPLTIVVKDSSDPPLIYTNILNLTPLVTSPPAIPAATSPAQATCSVLWSSPGIPAEDQIEFAPSNSGVNEMVVVQGGDTPPSVTVNNQPLLYQLGLDRQVIVDVEPGGDVPITVTYPAISPGTPGTFNLLFAYDQPESDALKSNYYGPSGVDDPLPPNDTVFSNNTVPTGIPGGESFRAAAALRYWVKKALDLTQPIFITAIATNEGLADKNSYAVAVSQRRGDIAKQIVAGVLGAQVPAAPTCQTVALPSSDLNNVAIVTGTLITTPKYILNASLKRDAGLVLAAAAATTPPEPPCPPTNPKPNVLRRLSIRVRLEKNYLVMAEISGEIDFKTHMKEALAQEQAKTANDYHLNPDSNDDLDIKSSTAASKNPADGIVDFTLNVTYDLATHDLTETLTLGAAPADIDGLLHMDNPNNTKLGDILGAVLIFTPILSAATQALDPKGAGDWAQVTIALGAPCVIGLLKLVKTTRATLYGGTLQLRQNIPGGSAPTEFTNASLTFDYGVSFGIDVKALKIRSKKTLSVRYKAVGVNLHFDGPTKFQFVLDTSKGYSLDLSDPGLFNLPGELGDILKIAAARIARFNPLTLELDLEIKADLGVITVDKFMVKVPLDDPPGLPMILPSGIKVNIPATITGSGSVKINGGGLEGTIDLTLCALKLRIAASVGVQHLPRPGDPPSTRQATAFFLGLEVDFPTPIMLGSTGLGLFGLFGLFGMHYDRVLTATAPGDAVGPDLRWLMTTEGKPYTITSTSNTVLWGPRIDNWAFGVGVVLGSVDGYLLNLRGMFLLTLPGPRIIITVNLKFIKDLPELSKDAMDVVDLDVGIVGILDIDIGAGQITLGVMIDLDVAELISIQIPVELFFSWNDPSTWHLWIGTIQTPASANILGIVRGGGYFMIGGQAIQPFPPGSTTSLPGVAVAMGIFAGIMWGSESAGIYLKVAASADFGVSFSPHLFIAGRVHLEGELRLVVISIGASGDFDVTAPNPVFLHVHICGHVKFFFFSISACIDFFTGSQIAPPPPPPLVSNMYLQSFAPVIAQGQGDRPIDASLGDAVVVGSPQAPPVVPIDSIPVLQLMYGVSVVGASTFTVSLPACPTYPGSPGVNLGGERFAQYTLTSLSIDPPWSGVQPPVAWRPNKPSNDSSQTRVDLALFTRNPNVTNSAVERSKELTQLLTSTWGNACDPIAPPACVFWAFCGQRIGTSPTGWTLYGTPMPDPPNTTRLTPVPTEMQVEQPALSSADALLLSLAIPLSGQGLYPAQVIGSNAAPLTAATSSTTSASAEVVPVLLTIPAVPVTPAFVVTVSPSQLMFFGFAPSPVIAPQSVGIQSTAPGAMTVSYSTAAGGNWLSATPMSGNAPATVTVSVNAAGMPPGTYRGTVTLALTGALPGTSQTQTVAVSLIILDPSGSCLRAVELPELLATRIQADLSSGFTSGTSQPPPPPAALAAAASNNALALAAANRWLRFHTGASKRLRLLLAVNAGFYKQVQAQAAQGSVVIRERDQSGALVLETPLPACNPVVVTSAAALPPAWTSTTGPWYHGVFSILTLLNSQPGMTTLFIELAPKAATTTIEVAVTAPTAPRPSVIVGAVESCPASENTRYQNGLQNQASTVGALQGYLDGGTSVPLLTPDTLYTITVQYTAAANGSSSANVTQGYRFRTDRTPPARLDPWVLCTWPDQTERYFFYNDPVDVIFNSQSIFDLFDKYGYHLVMDLRAADGLPETFDPGVEANTKSVAIVGPATYDSLLDLVVNGVDGGNGKLPCVTSSTSITPYRNAIFSPSVHLRPLMGYTLDVNTSPAIASPPDTPITPLFRRQFSTGRYADMQALADDLGAVRIKHRALKIPLDFPVTGDPKVIPDLDIQQAFSSAGEQALPAPDKNEIVMYWVPATLGGSVYVPHAILIDCIEPLWRKRPEPVFTCPIPTDASFRIVTIALQPSLEVVERAGSAIGAFIVSPGGARTVAMFKAGFSPPASETVVTLKLHRPASAVYGNGDVTIQIVGLPVSAHAPWENDHV